MYVIPVTPTENGLFHKICRFYAKICIKYVKIPIYCPKIIYMSTLGKNRLYLCLAIC